jgi:hypothetical protein
MIFFFIIFAGHYRGSISRQVNGKQKGFVHFAGDHSLSGRDKVVEDRKIPAPGDPGQG